MLLKIKEKTLDVEVKKIYTANGAAERAITYRKKYNNNILT